MALMDVAIGILANQAMNYLVSGIPPHRTGNAHPNLAPYAVFDCADGWIIIAVGNDGQFRHLCTLLGIPEMADDPAFATNPDRVANRAAMTDRLNAATRRFTRAELMAACERGGVPAGVINDIAEAFADPQVMARGMRIDPAGIPGIRTPVTFSGSPLALDRPAPKLGEHQPDIAGRA
jgi:crotonobetainyl-CoA:carnitine CoA-transferase CaiB-like acyl-CoA transferase